MTESPLPLARLYRDMRLIRRVEERIAEIYHTDKIKSPVHLSIGQEAPAVAVCGALRVEDWVFGTYRGHAQYLAKGGDLKRMVAELYGKVDGCGRGKSGSMHLGDTTVGFQYTSAIVATVVPHAVGYAFAQRLKGTDNIGVTFFGDGAFEEGVTQESLNFAALKKLPVLFVLENNGYAIHSKLTDRVKQPNYCERARAIGLHAEYVDTQDVQAMHRRALAAIDYVRSGAGPMLLEIKTYRWREHVGPGEDWHFGYRSKEEGDAWMRDCALLSAAERLGAAEAAAINAAVEAELDEAFAFAEASAFPGDDELLENVYA